MRYIINSNYIKFIYEQENFSNKIDIKRTYKNSLISNDVIFSNLLKDKKNKNYFTLLVNSIFKLFTFEINEPRILINKNYAKFISALEKNCKVLSLDINENKFSNLTHFLECDLGIFCKQNKNEIEFYFYSGSGKQLSGIKMSIIENNFRLYKNDVKKHKKSLKINKKHIKNKKYELIAKSIQAKEQDKKYELIKEKLINL